MVVVQSYKVADMAVVGCGYGYRHRGDGASKFSSFSTGNHNAPINKLLCRVSQSPASRVTLALRHIDFCDVLLRFLLITSCGSDCALHMQGMHAIQVS